MKRKKITFAGAGNVGATAAHLTALKKLGDIVLIDIAEGIPQGKALDMLESSPVERFDLSIKGTNDYKDTKDSDIVVITAGIARKPGMSRDDLIATNEKIVKQVTENIVKYSPDCFIIIVTNPLDVMAQVVKKASGFPKNRVIGMAGILDTARFRTFIAQELKVSVEDVNAFVLGGHGDSMVPLIKYTNVAGIPLSSLMPREKIDAIVQRTKDGGAEIVALLKTGSAYYAPGSSIVEMIDAILRDKKKILPCAAYLEGEYGAEGIFMGVPVKLGKDGIEEVVKIELSEEEKKDFDKSVGHVKELVSKLQS